MARSTRRRAHPLMVVVALAIIAPGILADGRALTARPRPDAPPSLDVFLGAVRRATPLTARILAAGAPPALVFYRATAALYPRRVYSAFPTDYAHSATAPAVDWPTLARRARHDGEAYVLLWSQQPHVHAVGAIVARGDAGELVRVTP